MLVKKNFVQNCFDQAIEIFEDKIMKMPTKVEIEFASKDEFVEHTKSSPLVQTLINMGVYKDIEKEFPSSMCVLAENKHPLRAMMGLPYIVTFSLDITKRIFKPYNKKECEEYLVYGFIHEFAHLFEPQLIQSKDDVWNECLEETHSNIELAKEMFAERIAEIIGVSKKTELMQREIWSQVHSRME